MIYRILANIVSSGEQNGKVQIFIFHRVLDQPDPLSPSEPDVTQFSKIIHLLSSTFNVISLEEAVERIKTNSLPKRAACITFDDGYTDNYTNAYPILKKYNVPATIFIATDFIDGGVMWNDVVIESIRSCNKAITIDDFGIREAQCDSFDQKQALLTEIIPKIKYMPITYRNEMVMAIQEMTGYKKKSFMMSSKQIINLRDNQITIGAHTCSHPILAKLNDNDARIEIGESREILERIINDKITLFAYPNGRPGIDYTPRDTMLVKELGFDAAVSTRKSVATYNDNLFELPRFTPWDKNMNKFMLRNLVETFKARN